MCPTRYRFWHNPSRVNLPLSTIHNTHATVPHAAPAAAPTAKSFRGDGFFSDLASISTFCGAFNGWTPRRGRYGASVINPPKHTAVAHVVRQNDFTIPRNVRGRPQRSAGGADEMGCFAGSDMPILYRYPPVPSNSQEPLFGYQPDSIHTSPSSP